MPALKTVADIAKELTRREGMKKQVDIAQASELLGSLSDMVFEQIRSGTKDGDQILQVLYKNGSRRARLKKKV